MTQLALQNLIVDKDANVVPDLEEESTFILLLQLHILDPQQHCTVRIFFAIRYRSLKSVKFVDGNLVTDHVEVLF